LTINKPEKEKLEISNQSNENRLQDVLQLKIVFWGPGESGKTTNYFRLREKFNGIVLNKGISISTTDGRTLWQDSIRISCYLNLGDLKYNIIIQIVTCTGQERFLPTREYVLDGADGVIFVADSNIAKMEQNKRSFRELISFTNEKKIPFVIQLNKRDIESAVSIADFKRLMELPPFEQYSDGTKVVYPTVALQGENVRECFEDLMFQVISNFFMKR
jgi:signal recognition particle receptor subunit beta